MKVSQKSTDARKFICSAKHSSNGQIADLTCTELVSEEKLLVKTSSGSSSIRYIRGGEPNGGDGSKHHPWNSLTDAEGRDWTTLIILPSSTVLYGGIALYDGQEIRGERRSQALLGSLNDNIHNGDVIVSNGNNRISHLTIVTAFRSAIEALHAENLIVDQVTIEESNTSGATFPADFATNLTTITRFLPWAAISFFGGVTAVGNIQPYNTRSGKFTLTRSILTNFRIGVIVGSGDSTSPTALPPTYFREYEISRTEFTKLNDTAPTTMAIFVYATTGGVVSGSIDRSSFNDLLLSPTAPAGTASATAITFDSPRTNLNFPGRDEVTFLTNRVRDSHFENVGSFGVIMTARSTLLGNKTRIIVEGNRFINVGAETTQGPPAGIKDGSAAINTQVYYTGSGYYQWIVRDNDIIDNSGLASGITIFMRGGPTILDATIENNNITGTTTGIDVIIDQASLLSSDAIADIYIAKNRISDVDAALVVAGSMRNITDVKIIVEDNCFENTGNRQRELGRPGIFPGGVIPGTNNSYYGGTVIYGGGLRNPAIQDAGITSASTGVILDLGNGELGSLGHNNFIDVSGPDVWIETGSFLSAERNWFAGGAPVAAGGGFVDFQPQLKSGPRTCHENDSSSSD